MARAAEQVVGTDLGAGIESERGVGIDAERLQKRIELGKPKDLLFDESPATTTYRFGGFNDRRDVIFVATHAVTNTSVRDLWREPIGGRLATVVVLDELRRNNGLGTCRNGRPPRPGCGEDRPCGSDRLCGSTSDSPGKRGKSGRSDGEMPSSRHGKSRLDGW